MTAIVGILNKRAVAIAADSTVTVKKDGKAKFFNNTRKIFSLSENIPVGIMMTGDVEFMGMPWDVIFGQYKAYRNGKPLPHLKDYMDDFLSFLTSFPHLNTKEVYNSYLYEELTNFYYTRKAIVDSRIREEQGKATKRTFMDHLADVLTEDIETFSDICQSENMKEIGYKKFYSIAKKQFESLKKTISEEGVPAETLPLWERIFYDYITSSESSVDSQIIFTGYGEDEIYPSIQAATLSGIIDGKLRFHHDSYNEITNVCSSAIIPFAQYDVMIGLLNGIAPDMCRNIMEKMDEYIEKARELIITRISEAGYGIKIREILKSVQFDDLSTAFSEDIHKFVCEHYTDSLLETVNFLSAGEMADMAESLISITSLHKHCTSSEESVGGPVTVAVITKAEGFRWVKTGERL